MAWRTQQGAIKAGVVLPCNHHYTYTPTESSDTCKDGYQICWTGTAKQMHGDGGEQPCRYIEANIVHYIYRMRQPNNKGASYTTQQNQDKNTNPYMPPFSTKLTYPQLSKTWPPAACWSHRCSLCCCDDRICSLATKPCLWWIGRGWSAGCLERSVACLEGSRCLERWANPERLKRLTSQIWYQIHFILITTQGHVLSLLRSQISGPRTAGLDVGVCT